MLHLIQVMVHMLNVLGYTKEEVATLFRLIENAESSVEELMEIIGMEPTEYQLNTMKAKVCWWRSALELAAMRAEDNLPEPGA
jgi:hypothetical protein